MLLFLSTGRDYFPSLWFWVSLYCLWPIAQLPNLGLKRIGRLLFFISWNAPLLRTKTPCFKEIQKKAMWRKEDKKALLPVELADNRQPWETVAILGQPRETVAILNIPVNTRQNRKCTNQWKIYVCYPASYPLHCFTYLSIKKLFYTSWNYFIHVSNFPSSKIPGPVYPVHLKINFKSIPQHVI